MKKTKGIVVALYKEPDISWVYKTNVDHIYVYDKGSDGQRGIPLPNIGRESHTYLNHIIRNYNCLDDLTIFSQADPFDHGLSEDIFNSLTPDFKGYKYLSQILQCDNKGNPHDNRLNLDKVYLEIFKNKKVCPKKYKFAQGAIFCVSKDKILNKSINFYKNCLSILGDEIDPINGYIFERMWSYIFS